MRGTIVQVPGGCPIEMEDGSVWVYDKEERDWYPAIVPTVAPSRPEVADYVDDSDFCPWCMACVCCGRPVEIH